MLGRCSAVPQLERNRPENDYVLCQASDAHLHSPSSPQRRMCSTVLGAACIEATSTQRESVQGRRDSVQGRHASSGQAVKLGVEQFSSQLNRGAVLLPRFCTHT